MLKKDRAKVGSEVVARVVEGAVRQACDRSTPLAESVNETLYHELERLRKARDNEATRTDRAMYGEIRRSLPKAGESEQRKMLTRIVERYVEEVTGNFNPLVYEAATRALPLGLTGLLNGLSPRRLLFNFGQLPSLDRQIVIQGHLDQLKALYRHGTVVFVPTHSSNLDSPILGYSIFRMQFPPVTYGAGLNLFSNPMVGFFMHNLGAYTVDRRKTDPLYRQALKQYATVTMENGYHQLFFPGGTRCRSNHLETRLKKGLLGTTIDAYRNNLLAGSRKKASIFVVPVTFSYPLVLEAATLMEDHLKRSGKARYIIVDDEFSRIRRWYDFFKGVFSLDQRIYATFGKPMDPFGNDVNEGGGSLDPRGRPIDPSGYLTCDGRVSVDKVRDAEYTNQLASRIVSAYRKENVALATNVVAFCFFTQLRQLSQEPDLYRFLRETSADTSLSLPAVERNVEAVTQRLKEMAKQGLVRISHDLQYLSSGDILRGALRSFGTYHNTPVISRRGVRLYATDMNLSLYYSNRLAGYGLEALVASAGGVA
jgi:glycerol-3-phosphate O-acyltransferase